MSLLLIDLSYWTYRAAAAHPNLTSEGRFTGGIYGFLQSFGRAVRETGATRVAFACDTKPYRRSLEYPQYKMLRRRERDPELAERQDESMRYVRDLLLKLGHYPVGAPGFEADDVIADLALSHRHRFQSVYIGSNDSDLYQLLGAPNIAILKPAPSPAAKLPVVRGETLKDPKGRPVTPEQYALATALMGTHNDIEGIPGVGEGRAFDAVRDPAKLRELMGKHGDVVRRNQSLIALPHRDMGRLRLPPAPDFNPRALYAELGRLDIETTDAMTRAFDQVRGRA